MTCHYLSQALAEGHQESERGELGSTVLFNIKTNCVLYVFHC